MPEISQEISDLAVQIIEEQGCYDSDQTGICIKCGEVIDGGVEPDAEKYACPVCGDHAVYGVEQIILLTVG